jgi:membrane associated rhomboid family serine protease
MSGLLDDFRDEFNKPNNTLVQLILVNVVVFLVLLLANVGFAMAQHDVYYKLVLEQLTIPASLNTFLRRPWTLITYFFTHQDVFHILFNMLYLYWFGRLIDEYLGNRRLVGLYMLGGIAGGLIFLFMYNLVPFYKEQIAAPPMLGASAAAYAVAVGAATLLPNYTFHLLFFGPVKIKYIVSVFVVFSIAKSIGPNAGGELAHLGGAALGFIYIKLLQNGTDMGQPVYWVMAGWQNLTNPKPPVKVSYRQRSTSTSSANSAYISPLSTSASAISMPDQDEVDAILDKISKSGYESLTREEKQKLFRASQQG